MKQTAKRKRALQVGPTVYLRPPESEDGGEWINLNRRSITFYKGLATPMLTVQRFAAYVERCKQADFAGFLVCRLEDDAIVGSINLSQIFRGGFQNAYLGYQVGAPYAGQGYLTEAIRLILKQAFTRMKLHRLEANIQPDNVASIALVRRAGFRKEGYSRRYLKIGGRWRDHERWAILAEDWRK
jgi:[ribosomal protein S5]-alanine N-acetyltransferase